MLREGAKHIQELGVRVEMEIFDTGHLWFAKQLVDEGLIDTPPMFQLCIGIPYGAPADPALLAAMVNQLPGGCGLGLVRPRPDADAVGGAVGAARRSCPGRPRGQPLPQQGRQGDQRPARRTGPDDHRGDGGDGRDA